MSLIDETKKLRELEQQATPGKWFVEESEYQWDLYAVNHDLEGTCPEHPIFERAHPWKLISANKNGYWPPEPDAKFIPEMRNLAPAMLEVLGMIREGDADTLDELLSDWVYSEQHPAVEVLNRLQKMAALMGNDEATAALVRERII